MSDGPAERTTGGRVWRVGDLAARTGLTVRTLHHYDDIGLLRPSGRTDSAHGSGHRLYTDTDVARLQQILSLRLLGFPLESIRDYLTRDDYEPRRVVRLHLERVRTQAAELRRLEGRLAALADALETADAVSVDEFLATIKVMTMFEKYYTPEQLEQLAARRTQVGEERIRQVEQDWPELIAEVRAALEAGLDPADPKAQDMARRWYGLVGEFTGGDKGIAQSLKNMYNNEDQIRGMNVAEMRPLMAFIGKAADAAGLKKPWE